jgi:hypothetical protein
MAPKGTPRIGAPRDLHEREQEQIQADVESREAALDEAALDRQGALVEPEVTLELSPEEIAKEEAEREQLAADLKASRPPKPCPERSAPETLSSRPISEIGGRAPERIPEVVVELAYPEPDVNVRSLEAAEAELRALEQDESASLDAELRTYEQTTALEMKRLKEAGDAKRAEIRQRQEVARKEIEQARAAALPTEIKQKAATVTQTAEDNRTRMGSTLESQRAAVAAEWAPALELAKRTVAEIAKLNKVFGPSLREMSDIAAFTDTNNRWPTELRMKLRDQCILPARKLVVFLDNYERHDYTRETPLVIIKQVEQMLQAWSPKTMVATLRQQLGYINQDAVRYVRNQIKQINDAFEIIEAQGKEYVASGAVPHSTDMNPVTERIRQEAKEDLIARGLRDPRQNYASGMGEFAQSSDTK